LWRHSLPIHCCGVDPRTRSTSRVVADDRYSRAADLDALAWRADVVSFHLALTNETRGLIGEAFFHKLQVANRSIALVNSARGDVVDEAALLRALDDGIVPGGVLRSSERADLGTATQVGALRWRPQYSQLAAVPVGGGLMGAPALGAEPILPVRLKSKFVSNAAMHRRWPLGVM
jgi:hypothetical protein